MRQESWGAKAFARDPVRAATTTSLEAATSSGLRVRLTQTVHRGRAGESLYVPERSSDRVVLKALAGSGERTRLEFAAPVGGGTLEAGVAYGVASGRRSRTQWSLEWTRRARLKK